MSDLISRQAAIEIVDRYDKSHMILKGKPMLGAASIVIELEDLPSAQPEPQWISCKDRLPKQGQEVICQCRANIIKVLKLDADGDWYQDAEHCYMGGFAVAWMPLPEPYKGEHE